MPGVRIAAWLPRAAAARPDHPAIETPEDGPLTYGALLAAADAGARRLAALGVARGDRVALVLPPGRAFAVALHAAWRLGAVPVPVAPRLTPEERAARLAGARVVLDGAGDLDGPGHDDAPLLAEVALDAPAVVLHTSGTTAAPRPVVLTAGNLLWSALGSALALGTDAADRWLLALPVAHVGGLSVLVRSVLAATTAVVHPRWDTGAALRALREERISVVSLVPTTLARLLDAGLREPRHLRVALLGGAGAPRALLERAAAAGVPVAPTYGMTETASQVTTAAPGDVTSSGRPLLPTRVRIAGDGGIEVAGPTVAPGAADADGWLRTGDLGRLTADGRLVVTGRRDDLVITGGENVAPAEVEAVLAGHPDVADVAVLGRADADLGQVLVALVVPRAGAGAPDPEALRAFCDARLAPWKVPRRFEPATALPRTASGKLLRRELT